MVSEELLTRCIAAVEAGENPIQVAARHPEHAAELVPLLQAVVALRIAPKARMSGSAFAAGRSAIAAAAQRAQQLGAEQLGAPNQDASGSSTVSPNILPATPQFTDGDIDTPTLKVTGVDDTPTEELPITQLPTLPWSMTGRADAERDEFSARGELPQELQGVSSNSPTTQLSPTLEDTQFSSTVIPELPNTELANPQQYPQQYSGGLDAETPRKRSFIWPNITSAAAIASILMLIVLIAAGNGRSLPGDPLYTLKRASEGFQRVILGATGDEANWYANQAVRRLQEALTLEAQGTTVEPALITEIVENTNAALSAVDQLPTSERARFLLDWQNELTDLRAENAPSDENSVVSQTLAQTTMAVTIALDEARTSPTVLPLPPTATASPTPSATPTDTPVETATTQPSVTPISTQSGGGTQPTTEPTTTEPTSVATEVATQPPTSTTQPTVQATATPQPTAAPQEPTATPQATNTGQPTQAPSATPTYGPTLEPTPTWTPQPTATVVPSATPTVPPTATPTIEPTPTETPVETPAETPTEGPTEIPSETPTPPLETATATPGEPTSEPTVEVTPTEVPTESATPEITSEPTVEPTATQEPTPDEPTPTPSPIEPTSSPQETPPAETTPEITSDSTGEADNGEASAGDTNQGDTNQRETGEEINLAKDNANGETSGEGAAQAESTNVPTSDSVGTGILSTLEMILTQPTNPSSSTPQQVTTPNASQTENSESSTAPQGSGQTSADVAPQTTPTLHNGEMVTPPLVNTPINAATRTDSAVEEIGDEEQKTPPPNTKPQLTPEATPQLTRVPAQGVNQTVMPTVIPAHTPSLLPVPIITETLLITMPTGINAQPFIPVIPVVSATPEQPIYPSPIPALPADTPTLVPTSTPLATASPTPTPYINEEPTNNTDQESDDEGIEGTGEGIENEAVVEQPPIEAPTATIAPQATATASATPTETPLPLLPTVTPTPEALPTLPSTQPPAGDAPSSIETTSDTTSDTTLVTPLPEQP